MWTNERKKDGLSREKNTIEKLKERKQVDRGLSHPL
jgi:hypothetical protein